MSPKFSGLVNCLCKFAVLISLRVSVRLFTQVFEGYLSEVKSTQTLHFIIIHWFKYYVQCTNSTYSSRSLWHTNYLQKPNFKFHVLSSTRKANITSMNTMIRGKMDPAYSQSAFTNSRRSTPVSTQRKGWIVADWHTDRQTGTTESIVSLYLGR